MKALWSDETVSPMPTFSPSVRQRVTRRDNLFCFVWKMLLSLFITHECRRATLESCGSRRTLGASLFERAVFIFRVNDLSWGLTVQQLHEVRVAEAVGIAAETLDNSTP